MLRLGDRHRRAAARHVDAWRFADASISQSRQLRIARRQGRDRGAQPFRRIRRQDRGRSDQPRHRPRPLRVAEDQPANRTQHRHGRRLLPRTVASRLCQGHDGRDDRGGDRPGLRRLGRRARGLRRNHRRDRDQQGFHPGRGEGAERRGARLEAQRRPSLRSSSGLGAPRPSGARCRRERRRGPAARRALPHEPEPARPQVSAEPGGQGRLHRIRYDRHGLLLRRPAGPVAVRRRKRASPSASWSTTAISTRFSCRRTCS